ncbi:MAG: STAS domain-containing protein [Vicinamibacteraceae bacterium]
MDVKVDRHDELVTVALAGRVDTRAAFELERTLLATAHDGARFLVIDFGAVTLFEGAAIRVLIMLRRRLEVAQGMLVLCALPPHVHDVLEVAGLAGQFTIVPTGADALACLPTAAPEDSGRAALARRVVRLLTIGESRADLLLAPTTEHSPASTTLSSRVADLLSRALDREDGSPRPT